jgi:thymidine phosphorylase
MKDKENAISLSKTMKEIGNLAGIETVCIITNMDEPVRKSNW